jgi:prepilin-type N-terminal cleavage/methylation domain-containing protein
MQTQKGFTLIELMVVVTIIILLMAAITYSFLPALSKSRDTRRFTDLKDLQKALNLSFVSHGRFPVSTSEVTLTGSDVVNTLLFNDGDLRTQIKDPLSGDTESCGSGNTCNYYYQSNSGGTLYQLRFCLETDGANSSGSNSFVKGCTNILKP